MLHPTHAGCWRVFSQPPAYRIWLPVGRWALLRGCRSAKLAMAASTMQCPSMWPGRIGHHGAKLEYSTMGPMVRCPSKAPWRTGQHWPPKVQFERSAINRSLKRKITAEGRAASAEVPTNLSKHRPSALPCFGTLAWGRYSARKGAQGVHVPGKTSIALQAPLLPCKEIQAAPPLQRDRHRHHWVHFPPGPSATCRLPPEHSRPLWHDLETLHPWASQSGQQRQPGG